ncbi:MAG: hypothetical protein AB1422_15455 [bacterium]
MIEKLKEISSNYSLPEDLNQLFKTWESSEERKRDRSIVSRILMYFKEPSLEELRKIWSEFIEWLLYKCVDEEKNIGMIEAKPSIAHEKIAEMYKKAEDGGTNAICLTINFDSLLYKALSAKFDEFDEKGKIKKKNAYTYFEPEGCEEFFKRMEHHSAVAEIQARENVFWAKCKSSLCNLRNKSIPLLISVKYGLGGAPTKCECGGSRDILIAFPGTYEKDRIMQEMLAKIWRYLAYRISCVITIGLSGAWDPVLIAFLSDLLGERGIPLIDVNKKPEDSCLVKEIVETGVFDAVSITQPADNFMEDFVKKYGSYDL